MEFVATYCIWEILNLNLCLYLRKSQSQSIFQCGLSWILQSLHSFRMTGKDACPTVCVFDVMPVPLVVERSRNQQCFSLVPKVLFGNVLISETLFRTKRSFYGKCVPKQSLGTRKYSIRIIVVFPLDSQSSWE